MKQTTARALVETIRNLRGILTIWESWIQAEGRLFGTVSLGPSRPAAAPSASPASPASPALTAPPAQTADEAKK